MNTQGSSEGGWPAGWLIAAMAGVIAAILARWIGGVGMPAAVLVGIFVFLVFGVLLGMFWSTPASTDGHGHGDDGHWDNGHDDSHGRDHAAPSAAPMMPSPAEAPSAPFVAAPVVAFAPAAAVAVPAPPVITPVISEPAAVAAPMDVDDQAAKPAGLSGPRGGTPDALQTIEGIGPALEKLCHEMGIYHFDQIGSWGAAEVAWMDSNLKGFKGRVTRDRWVRQAALIGEVGTAEFLRRAKTNDY